MTQAIETCIGYEGVRRTATCFKCKRRGPIRDDGRRGQKDLVLIEVGPDVPVYACPECVPYTANPGCANRAWHHFGQWCSECEGTA